MPIGQNTAIIPMYVVEEFNGNTPNLYPHYWYIGNFDGISDVTQLYTFSGSDNTLNNAPVAVPSADTLAIDVKIDNGAPDKDLASDAIAHNVIDLEEEVNAPGCDPSNAGTPISPGKYDVSSPANTCALFIKMLSTNGMKDTD